MNPSTFHKIRKTQCFLEQNKRDINTHGRTRCCFFYFFFRFSKSDSLGLCPSSGSNSVCIFQFSKRKAMNTCLFQNIRHTSTFLSSTPDKRAVNNKGRNTTHFLKDVNQSNTSGLCPFLCLYGI